MIIPPSIPMILFAVSTDTSTGELFIAGVMPGILIGLALMLYVWLYAGAMAWARATAKAACRYGRPSSAGWR